MEDNTISMLTDMLNTLQQQKEAKKKYMQQQREELSQKFSEVNEKYAKIKQIISQAASEEDEMKTIIEQIQNTTNTTFDNNM